ncbi:MAG: MFS transporter [Pseudonocardiaceae bacterium]
MSSVIVLLLVSPHYSYAVAGLAVSASMLGNAVSAPLRGRVVDRRPIAVVLPVFAGLQIVMIVGLLWSVLGGAPAAVAVGFAAMTGLSYPPVTLVLRRYWQAHGDQPARSAALALDSALMDVSLISGPAFAAWLSTTMSPVSPFVVSGVLMGGSAVLILTVPHPIPPDTDAGTTNRQRWSVPLLSVLGVLTLFCAALAAIEVALPIYAQQQDRAELSGLYLAGMSAGSIVGVLAWRTRQRSLSGMVAVSAGGALLLAFGMHLGPLALLLLCPLGGLSTGLVFAALFGSIAIRTPIGTESRVQGWAAFGTEIGFAAGAAAGAGAASADGGPGFVFVSCAAVVAAEFLLALGRPAGSNVTVQRAESER